MGDGINIAARLESAQIAHSQIEPGLNLPIGVLGETDGTGLGDTIQLKNIAEPVRVYSLEVGKAASRSDRP